MDGEKDAESDADCDDEGDANLCGKPAEVIEAEGDMEEVAQKNAKEEHDPDESASGAEASQVGSDGQYDDDHDKPHDSVISESETERKGREHGARNEEHRDELALRPCIRHDEGRHDPDQAAEHHRDNEIFVIRERYAGCDSG